MSRSYEFDWDDTGWATRLPNYEAAIGPELQRHADLKRKVDSLVEQLELAELDQRQCEERMETIINHRYTVAEIDEAM